VRRTARSLIVALGAAALLALVAAPANAAGIVRGSITPLQLKGQPAVAMFFHPF
jgi:hypothetical protein